MTLRIAFMGSPELAVAVLEEVISAGHEVACVYSQPPRPAGRGKSERKTAVHLAAEAHGLEVRTPLNFKAAEDRAAFAALDLDAAVVVAYGLLLPQAILDAPRLGCINLHGSLLPRWRGAAPIQRAVLAGDHETGMQTMKMDAGLDTGPVIDEMRMAIGEMDTAQTVHDWMAREGGALMVRTLAALEAGVAGFAKQAEEGVTYAAKIRPDEPRIDWTQPARRVRDHIHGLSPQPGAWFELDGDMTGGKTGPVRVKVLSVACEDGSGPPGVTLDSGLLGACGAGAVRLLRLQRAGKGPMAADDFLRGTPIQAGRRLDEGKLP